jgi:hypothetical protein
MTAPPVIATMMMMLREYDFFDDRFDDFLLSRSVDRRKDSDFFAGIKSSCCVHGERKRAPRLRQREAVPSNTADEGARRHVTLEDEPRDERTESRSDDGLRKRLRDLGEHLPNRGHRRLLNSAPALIDRPASYTRDKALRSLVSRAYQRRRTWGKFGEFRFPR